MRKSFAVKTFVVLTLVATLLAGCQNTGAKKEESEQEAKSINVSVENPIRSDVEITGDFIGTVSANSTVNVVAKLSGDVTNTYFEVGDYVNAGDLMFTIDDTSARISMKQAQAALDSSRASLNSAQAGLDAAKVSNLYTTAQVTQQWGTAATNEMQLANAVNSAKYGLMNASENNDAAATQLEYLRDQISDIDSQIDKLEDNKDNMANYAKALSSVKGVYTAISACAGLNLNDTQRAAALTQIYNDYQITGMNLSTKDPEAAAKAYLQISTSGGASTVEELDAMISGANSAASAISSLESTKEQLLVSKAQAEVAKVAASTGVCQAQEAEALAQRMLDDYRNYTLATIITGGNAQLAGANSQVASAEAGVAQVKAGVTQAETGVEAAQLQLDYANVKAPVSGVVTSKYITVNNMAAAGSPAYVITADDTQYVDFYVSEAVMERLMIGQEIKVTRNGSEYTAKITENSGVADATNGLFFVKAQVVPGGEKLINGTKVKLTLATDSRSSVITVPVDSVYYLNEQSYVYVYSNGKAARRDVVTGISDGERIEITDGLGEQDKVITTWASQLRDGIDVTLDGTTPSGDKIEVLNEISD
ncbi:MAG: efflux RND transporter periplasmic adaptor subunit [Lachnospiraceae bacterium]|nr:efflux RND transporter periplasmic adaptor subunit [Lachnospiraceae bacterium]